MKKRKSALGSRKKKLKSDLKSDSITMTDSKTIAPPVNIITIGGGKGGIGKSVVSTNLAVGMALSGQNVILIDTDYGASNLHALLGIGNPRHGLLDFFTNENNFSNSLLLDTGISNLKFLSGAGDNPGSANLGEKQNGKIIEFISNLSADTILIDLGPGTSFSVLDYYNLGSQKVVMTIPEMPSVMNAFSFVKCALFRLLNQELSSSQTITQLTDFTKNPEAASETFSIDQLREKVKDKEPDLCSKIDEIVAAFQPHLIINRVRKQKDLILGQNLRKLVKKFLNVQLNYLGFVIESDRVRNSVNDMVPFLIKDPQSKPSENLQRIIGGLTHSDIQFIKKDGAIFVSKQVHLSSGWET